MDFKQAIETQRHRLLRLVAGLLVVVGILALGPVSRCFSVMACRFIGSVLCRAEAAAKYLVIAQARWIVSREGLAIDQNRILKRIAQISVEDDTDLSLSDCRRRLKRLRAVLLDIPHHAARLLHRIEKQTRRALGTVRVSCVCDLCVSAPLDEWRLEGIRIERPPDKSGTFSSSPAFARRTGSPGQCPVMIQT